MIHNLGYFVRLIWKCELFAWCWHGYLRSTQCAVLPLRLRFAVSSLKSWSGRLARDVTPVPSAAAARRWLLTATTPFVYLCPNSPLLPATHLLPGFNLAVVCLCIWPTFFRGEIWTNLTQSASKSIDIVLGPGWGCFLSQLMTVLWTFSDSLTT